MHKETLQDKLVHLAGFLENGTGPIHAARNRIYALENALREIMMRTSPYEDDPDFPLASGIYTLANQVVNKEAL